LVRSKVVEHRKRQLYDSKYPLPIGFLEAFERCIPIAEPGVDDGDIEGRYISLP
jgi:hypothetical protein